MKLLAGCVVSAGLLVVAWSANAQMLALDGPGLSPYQKVSDFEEPYGGPPPAPVPYGAPPPPYGAPPPGVPYGYEPALMPPREVYAVLRENGFLPLGIPHRQGFTYEIAAMDPDGEDGRLVIDGRNGRIIRFMPAPWMGRYHDSRLTSPYGAQAAVPPPTMIRGVPRPPAPIPHVSSRDVTSRPVPLPAPKPAETAAAQPQPQPHVISAAPPSTAGTVGEAKPQPVIKPTQDMPPVQALD
jgi:hypothetical protein